MPQPRRLYRATRPSPRALSPLARASSPAIRSRRPPRSPRSLPPPAAGGRHVHPDGRRDRQHRRRDRRLAGRRQGADRHVGPRLLAHAGEHRLRRMAQVPCVIVDVMRGGPSTGLPTEPSQGDVMQARWGTHGEHSIIALVPSSGARVLHAHRRGLQPGGALPHPGHRALRRLVGHMREAVALPSIDELQVAERGEPDCEPDEYDTVVSTVDNILPRPPLGSAVQGARHRPRLQPSQRGAPGPAPRVAKTWAATCARRSTITVTPSCASRTSRWRMPTWPSSPTAPSRGRRAPSCAGRARRACAWA